MGKTSLRSERDSAVDSSTCQHNWPIEAPKGPTSMGHYKKCGAEREFLNSLSVDLRRHDPDHWRRDDLW